MFYYSQLKIKSLTKMEIVEVNKILLMELQTLWTELLELENAKNIDNTEYIQYYIDENKAKIKLIQDGLIENNISMVRKISHFFDDNAYNIPYDEIECVGFIGLSKGVLRFKPIELKTFSTYLYKFIRGEIYRFFRDKSTVIKRPQKLKPNEVKYQYIAIDDSIIQVSDEQVYYDHSELLTILQQLKEMIQQHKYNVFIKATMFDPIGKALYWEKVINSNPRFFMVKD